MLVEMLLGILFVGGTVGLTFAAYLLMRVIAGKDPSGRDRELAGSIATRIAALHALILAFVFAQEMVEYQQLRNASATEANALADIYNDIARYDPASGATVRGPLADYVETVIDQEWGSLAGEDRLSPAAWAAWDKIYGEVLDLAASDPRQQSLRDHMLSSIHAISEQRVRRESLGRDGLSGWFWFAAASGVVFTALAYYPFQPDRGNMLLLGVYGAFTGIVMYLIYAFSDPYARPGALDPGAFLRLRTQIASGSG
jgi:phage shock protein PspC (stress-responsive transcriptional regulator)